MISIDPQAIKLISPRPSCDNLHIYKRPGLKRVGIICCDVDIIRQDVRDFQIYYLQQRAGNE